MNYKEKFSEEFASKMEKKRAAWPEKLTSVPVPKYLREIFATQLWRSRDFEVVVFIHRDGTERLSIHRNIVDVKAGSWKGDITHDELREIQRQCGRINKFYIEAYPPEDCFVDQGNFRHLWKISPEEIKAVWAHKRGSLSVLDDWPEKNILNNTSWSS